MIDFPTKILLATDGSDDAVLAARAAAGLSRQTGSELHVVHVWRADVPGAYVVTMPGARSRWYEQQAGELLAEQVERIEDAGGKVNEAHLLQGQAGEEITGLANELNVGLLVMGSRGLGTVKRLVVGSVSESVVRGASRPVLLLRGAARAWPPARIVIGEDFSEESIKAASLASSIGRLFGSQALLVHARPLLELAQKGQVFGAAETHKEVCAAGKALEVLALKLERVLGRDLQVKTVAGDAARCILNAAREDGEPALIVIGSRGLGTLDRLTLGSVSHEVMRMAVGPVLIYRQPPVNSDADTSP
ncbi:MAG TPA: universal stress protein [Rubrobacteraceae bacterium]|nr:universal stress protein [Rubrobacteraceae bacterium]